MVESSKDSSFDSLDRILTHEDEAECICGPPEVFDVIAICKPPPHIHRHNERGGRDVSKFRNGHTRPSYSLVQGHAS